MARILVIDDDQDTRTAVEEALKSVAHEVLSAADGREGVVLNRAKPADLVITDLFMPGQEGIETIRQLHSEFPKLSIIAMSGNPQARAMLSIAHYLGAVSILEKPFSPEQLLAAVAGIFAKPTAPK